MEGGLELNYVELSWKPNMLDFIQEAVQCVCLGIVRKGLEWMEWFIAKAILLEYWFIGKVEMNRLEIWIREASMKGQDWDTKVLNKCSDSRNRDGRISERGISEMK